MKNQPKPVAVLVSDIHLSSKQPVARKDDDWFAAQARGLQQMRAFATKNKLPVICAGDVFHLWKSTPEMINFALEHLPDGMWAIPGQHDLPFHNYNEMNKSAFGTLVKVGKMRLLKPNGIENVINTPQGCPIISAFAFPWGFEIKPYDLLDDSTIRLAVVHAYVWQKGSGYTNAPDERRVGNYKKQLAGYDVALFGDNHKGFEAIAGTCSVFNHGGFIRMKIDELDYRPGFGVLMSDKTVVRHYLDLSHDVFLPKAEAKFLEEEGFKMETFFAELKKLGSGSLDFTEAMKHYLTTYQVSTGAKELIISALHHNESS